MFLPLIRKGAIASSYCLDAFRASKRDDKMKENIPAGRAHGADLNCSSSFQFAEGPRTLLETAKAVTFLTTRTFASLKRDVNQSSCRGTEF
jgi:hypothetical protein